MIVPISMWNKKVANGDVRVVGKEFYYQGTWYKYQLYKGWVEITVSH